MGFSVSIEADHGLEILRNRHPRGIQTSGKSVLAFLSGLSVFSFSISDTENRDENLKHMYNWFANVEKEAETKLFPTCQALTNCMWSGDSDPTDYHEYQKHWQPIAEIIAGVALLLRLFQSGSFSDLAGFYEAEYTVPDFEALDANLKLLHERGNSLIRLNFQ